jgi:hypothetical protein
VREKRATFSTVPVTGDVPRRPVSRQKVDQRSPQSGREVEMGGAEY